MNYNNYNNDNKINLEPNGYFPIFAYMANYLDNKDLTSQTITVDTVKMSSRDFKYVFYNSLSDNFNLSRSNSNYIFLQFTNYTVLSKPFSLLDAILKAYEETSKNNRTSISPHNMILIYKNISKIKSILDVEPYLISISYDDIINQLKDNLVVKEKCGSTAQVTLLLSVKIHEPTLNIFLLINIPFNICIDGFKKIYKKDNHCHNPYSYEEVSSCSDDMSSLSFYNNSVCYSSTEESKSVVSSILDSNNNYSLSLNETNTEINSIDSEW